MPGSALQAEKCSGELGRVEESEAICPRCQKTFVILSCEMSISDHAVWAVDILPS